jgi:hypothetical protein
VRTRILQPETSTGVRVAEIVFKRGVAVLRFEDLGRFVTSEAYNPSYVTSGAE